MKKYKIGEFSRKMGVSTDLVKHYQSSEIVFPEIDETNGYRYYNIRHGERIIASRKYRKLGFSVNEAKEILYNKDVDTIKDMLLEKKIELDENIKRMQLRSARIEEIYKECEEVVNKVGTVEVVEGPGIYYLPHVIGTEFNENEEVIDELPEWMDALEFLYKVYDIRRDSDGIFFDKTIGFLVEESYFDSLGINKIQEMSYYPPSKRMIYYLKEEYCTSRRIVECVMEFLEKKPDMENKIKKEQIFAQHIMDGKENRKRYMYYKIICFLES